MPIDPTIALGFRSPAAASADSSQTSTLATLSQLMGLRQLVARLRSGQSLGGFMTGGPSAGDVNAGQGYPIVSGTAPAGGGTAAVPGPSTIPAMGLLPAAAGALMTGLSRYGENVYSHDGGKSWFSGQTGQPVSGDIYQQVVI